MSTTCSLSTDSRAPAPAAPSPSPPTARPLQPPPLPPRPISPQKHPRTRSRRQLRPLPGPSRSMLRSPAAAAAPVARGSSAPAGHRAPARALFAGSLRPQLRWRRLRLWSPGCTRLSAPVAWLCGCGQRCAALVPFTDHRAASFCALRVLPPTSAAITAVHQPESGQWPRSRPARRRHVRSASPARCRPGLQQMRWRLRSCPRSRRRLLAALRQPQRPRTHLSSMP